MPIDPSRRYTMHAEPEEETWHGTLGGYTNHKCRCEECREAHREYNRQAREDRAKTPWEEIPHGTVNGYTNFRCRCAECVAALALARQSWPSVRNRVRVRKGSEVV